MSGKAKCANCALAEKQKNAGGTKIKSFRVGLCVGIFPFLSVCIVIVIIFSLSNGCLSGLQCLFYHCLQRFAAKRRQGLNHCTFYEELNFKYTTFLSYEAQNPCLRLGAVMPSLLFFVRCGGAAILFGKFWLVWLELSDLPMCMDVKGGIVSV